MRRPRRLWAPPALPASLLALAVAAAGCGDPNPAERANLPPADPESAATGANSVSSTADAGSGSTEAPASYGVFEDSIVFGQSAALSGRAEGLGQDMRLGILAAFAEANRDGGVHGRRLRLVSRDDRYESELAIERTRELIAHGVFGLVGAVGTPTSGRAAPIAGAAGVPYIGAFTGAALLRGADQSHVVNLRASYDQETEEMVERLTTDLRFSRIALLYQDDSYGLAGRSGVMKALDQRNMGLVAEGTYVRNTVAVKRALLRIRDSNPQAVIIIGAYAPAAEFIMWARKIGLRAVFVNLSFVGSDNLLRLLGASGEGVVVTQVVPFPRDTSRPVVARYHAALREFDSSARSGFVSLEGYLVGRLVVEVLRASADPGGAPPTREAFLRTLYEAGPIDLGGFVVEYGSEDNQGSDEVFLTVIRDGRFVPVTRLSR